jgi:hypothetical protein
MTEETPFNPCSKKGEVGAKIAPSPIKECKAGSLTVAGRGTHDCQRSFSENPWVAQISTTMSVRAMHADPNSPCC